jgi:hypothetical protein
MKTLRPIIPYDQHLNMLKMGYILILKNGVKTYWRPAPKKVENRP